MLVLLCLLVTAAPSPLAAAKAHLAAGKLDEVLFDLDGKTLPESERPPAADILARAGQAAWRKEDTVLALQFAQMALRLKSELPLALEVGARASRAEKQYSPAEDYADRWMAAPQGGSRARLLRAEIAADQGEWQHGLSLADTVKERELEPDERPRLRLVRTTCEKELEERHSNVSEVKSLEARLSAAAEKARQTPDDAFANPEGAMNTRDVVVYGTSWCSYCAQARRYFRSRHIDFVDRDVEKDSQAADELAMKLSRAHQTSSGVPVIDVHGTLVHGFSREELDRLLP